MTHPDVSHLPPPWNAKRDYKADDRVVLKPNFVPELAGRTGTILGQGTNGLIDQWIVLLDEPLPDYRAVLVSHLSLDPLEPTHIADAASIGYIADKLTLTKVVYIDLKSRSPMCVSTEEFCFTHQCSAADPDQCGRPGCPHCGGKP